MSKQYIGIIVIIKSIYIFMFDCSIGATITATAVLFHDYHVFLTNNWLKLNFVDNNNIFSILIIQKIK